MKHIVKKEINIFDGIRIIIFHECGFKITKYVSIVVLIRYNILIFSFNFEVPYLAHKLKLGILFL